MFSLQLFKTFHNDSLAGITTLIIAMHCPATLASIHTLTPISFKDKTLCNRYLSFFTFDGNTDNQGPLTPCECPLKPIKDVHVVGTKCDFS